MNVQFIRGIAIADLQTPLVEAANQWLNEDAQHEVFYLVPNHIKFEQEIHILQQMKQQQANTSDSIASTRLQVFSFYRLAWYYLQHTQFYSSDVLSDAGAAMIFRKILTEHEEELQIFRGEINKAGFIQQLFHLYQEMKDGNIGLEDLYALLETQQPGVREQDLQAKFQDLLFIFTKFQAQISQYGYESTEILQHLSDYLESTPLQHVQFVVSGFERFTARELRLLEVLMTKAGSVKIALMLDRQYPTELPDSRSIFYEAGKTYHQLYQMARSHQIPVLADQVVPEQLQPLIVNPQLQALNHYWIAAQERVVEPQRQLLEGEGLELWQAENSKEEVTQVAREIRRLVSEEGYRYLDIQILTRDLPCYENLLEPIFTDHEIPIYVDREMTMERHPLVEWIDSLFAIAAYNYRYRDVLRFLRTELFFPAQSEVAADEDDWLAQRNEWRRKIDLTENVVLAYGYEGHYWQREKDWQFIRYDFETEEQEDVALMEQASNQVRQAVQRLLPVFFEAMTTAATGKEAATLFYRFLIECGVEIQLNKWRQQAIANGQLEIAKNHEQTWTALMSLLDDYVTVYGEERFDFALFQEVFTSGLEGLHYNKVPTAIDQVQVRRMDLTRPAVAKAVFAIGMTEEIFPQKVENKSLLSDEERQLVNDQLAENQYLSEDTNRKMAREPYVAYLVFSSAQQRLYLSYPAVKDTKQEVKASPYFRTIQQAFSLPLLLKNEVRIEDDAKTSLEKISTFRTLIGELTSLKRQRKETNRGLLPFWLNMEKSLMNQPLADLAERVFASLKHQNIPENIEAKLAEPLYGKHIYTSVSRMESFFRCQFQYFSRYGLGLKERTIFGLSSAATGEFFHESLDQFFKQLLTKQRILTEMSDKEVQTFAEEVIERVLDDPRFSVLTTSSRMNYLRYQLSQTVKKVGWALKRQSQRSGMSTVQTELLFGQIAAQKGIRGLELPLENNGKISVRGKIDRVDQIVTPEATYLGVIDYKSSHRKFNITEAYYGLAMQMLTYLDVALMDAVDLVGKAAKPAGSLYMHVHNPVLAYDGQTEVDHELLKKYQFDGLLLKAPDLLTHLDTSLEAKQSSLLFPIEKSAKELIKPGRRQEEKFVTEPELNALLKHNRSKFIEAGNRITGGEVQLNPAYQGKERIACRFCPFRSICEFDVMLKENNYNRMDHLSKEDVMHRLMVDEEKGVPEDE
ncbi:PD-(D/E)XK nuclease family protein [Enterococcus faecalis]